mmetsp:Transcript_46794/g.69229  ORF Transcript_46794/g.69229 Transcript_46794/m.69229 type:complete len:344 (-) Transcript_46794:275-1306(-)
MYNQSHENQEVNVPHHNAPLSDISMNENLGDTVSSMISPHSVEIEELQSMVMAMHLKETAHYSCPDYLARQKDMKHNDKTLVGSTDRHAISGKRSLLVDEFCREQICEWTFRVVDYFKINREIVAFSMSYLDRFLASYDCERKTFKLAATTSLYLAVKMHETRKFNNLLGILSDLSRGEFSVRHIEKMERVMLRSLNWLVHPPLPSCFVGHFILLSSRQSRVKPKIVRNIFDMACFFTELAVFDYHFVTKRPSLIALAGIVLALNTMSLEVLPSTSRTAFLAKIPRISPDLKHDSDEVTDIRSRLWEVYQRSKECENDKHGDTEDGNSRRISTSSPVSIVSHT